MNLEKIGKYIKKLRLEKGYTQEELAEHLFISSKSISRYETGKCMPDYQTLLELAQIFNVSVNDILCGEKVEDEKYNKKLEENLKSILKQQNDSNKKIKKLKKIVYLFITFIIIFILYILFKTIIFKYYDFNSDTYYDDKKLLNQAVDKLMNAKYSYLDYEKADEEYTYQNIHFKNILKDYSCHEEENQLSCSKNDDLILVTKMNTTTFKLKNEDSISKVSKEYVNKKLSDINNDIDLFNYAYSYKDTNIFSSIDNIKETYLKKQILSSQVIPTSFIEVLNNNSIDGFIEEFNGFIQLGFLYNDKYDYYFTFYTKNYSKEDILDFSKSVYFK